jgi:hypothetical protein
MVAVVHQTLGNVLSLHTCRTQHDMSMSTRSCRHRQQFKTVARCPTVRLLQAGHTRVNKTVVCTVHTAAAAAMWSCHLNPFTVLNGPKPFHSLTLLQSNLGGSCAPAVCSSGRTSRINS